jgi:hypothetical protein
MRNYEISLEPLVHEVNDKLNNSLFNQFKEEIDSEDFRFIELGEAPNPHSISRWPIVLFLTTAAICLLCSTIFHLFHPMSSRTHFPIQAPTSSLTVSTTRGSTC